MAKVPKLEELTHELSHIRSEPTGETGLATLKRVLASKHSVAVAQAAGIVSEHGIHALIPALVTAFNRSMEKGKERDPGCRAKQAIAEALYRLEYKDETPFLQGIHHMQWEPVWGGQIDTAPQLRGTCALGLVRMNYPDVMEELADLLADPEPEARIGAARAVAYSENPVGIALLRLRVKAGDTPPVIGECLTALLKLAPAKALPLLQTFLEAGRKESDPRDAIETAEIAALVLGESRLPEALPQLQDWWRRSTHPELRQTALLAIAMLRQDEALHFLLELLTEGSARTARDTLKALELYHDEFVQTQIQAVLEHRQDLQTDIYP